MDRLCFLWKAIFISYLCTTLTQALPSSSYFPKNATTSWKNDECSLETNHFSDGSLARFILLQVTTRSGRYFTYGFGFGFGFYCQKPTTDSCYLSIIFIERIVETISSSPPLIVWSANRDQPIGESSVLFFKVGGDLVLKDPNGRPVWSTNASSPSAIGMSIDKGNLALVNQSKEMIWQSFDHPTDTLLLGQSLSKGQQLISSVSSGDLSSGLFYLCVDSVYLSAHVAGLPHSLYLQVAPDTMPLLLNNLYILSHIKFTMGNLTFFYQGHDGVILAGWSLRTPISEYVQFLRLGFDGGLRLHSWEPTVGWESIHHFASRWGECQFPLKCGRYGVCRNGQCTCPVAIDGTNFFAPSDSQYQSHGCHLIDDPGTNYRYELQDFGQLSYFSYADLKGATLGLEDEESCKQACLSDDASCMAAFFYYVKTERRGYCYLVSEVFSLVGTPLPYDDVYTSSHIKVKISSTAQFPLPSSKSIVLPMALATCAFVLLCICVIFLLFRRKRIHRDKLYLKKLSETLLRFSYSELSVATQNFSHKLGGGGFGLVFKGTLSDGRVVAVKRLENDGQGKKEFMAEVETVGKVHHINVVNLIGFCVENKRMIIVYEYLPNGSLDKWIFCENQNNSLDWKRRRKIVLDIAKGLAYIHDECRQKIAHLDVKPHNILLDDNFNAKLSDFGMSKLIDRDKSQVMTGMRGTLGYLAPEWRGSRITVKADVYSFGILVLEVVSGRKILDYSQPESDVRLLKLLKKKSLENRLIDIVDNRCEGIASNTEDVSRMIRLAIWCLHNDYKRRPTMSSVVKVMEGSLELEPNITYNFDSIFSPDSNALASASTVNPI